MQNLILPTDNTLSLTANGLLTAMVNCPEKDYSSVYELYALSNDDYETIKTAVDELIKAEYLISVGDSYAVNKVRITEMKVINSAEKIVRTFNVTAEEHEKSGI